MLFPGGFQPSKCGEKLASSGTSAALALGSLTVFPLFLAKTNQGWDKLDMSVMSKSLPLVIITAVSNEAFYMSSAFNFLENAKNYCKSLKTQAGTSWQKPLGLSLIILVIATFSGEGMDREARGLIENGFPETTKRLLESPGISAVFNALKGSFPYLAMFYAGTIVNGSSAMGFHVRNFVQPTESLKKVDELIERLKKEDVSASSTDQQQRFSLRLCCSRRRPEERAREQLLVVEPSPETGGAGGDQSPEALDRGGQRRSLCTIS